MPIDLGQLFAPGSQQTQGVGRGTPQAIQAIKVLSLRLPKILEGLPFAPPKLIGAGPAAGAPQYSNALVQTILNQMGGPTARPVAAGPTGTPPPVLSPSVLPPPEDRPLSVGAFAAPAPATTTAGQGPVGVEGGGIPTVLPPGPGPSLRANLPTVLPSETRAPEARPSLPTTEPTPSFAPPRGGPTAQFTPRQVTGGPRPGILPESLPGFSRSDPFTGGVMAWPNDEVLYAAAHPNPAGGPEYALAGQEAARRGLQALSLKTLGGAAF